MQQLTETAGTLSANETKAWSNYATLWAQRDHLHLRGESREIFAAQQVTAELRATFTIRHRTDLTPKMRIYDQQDGKTYDILSIAEVPPRNQWLQIIAAARTD